MVTCHQSIPILDESSIGNARRASMAAARESNFNETDIGRVSIVATELATNLLRHANSATRTVLLGSDKDGVELLSIDAGPGMRDPSRCFTDGYSTGGTSGTGLGAVARISAQYDFYTGVGGTVLWCRVAPSGEAIRQPKVSIGGISTPIIGESVCGDIWRILHHEDGRIAVLLADGLGHGPLACEAAEAMAAVFLANPFTDPAALLQTMSSASSGTRGAAVAVAQINTAAGTMTYCGVGNISGTLVASDGATRGLCSHNGTVGHQMRRTQNFEYPWSSNSIVIMHSDGLQTRWSLANYVGLTRRHPSVTAGVLYRDFRRGRNDATVVVIAVPVTNMQSI